MMESLAEFSNHRMLTFVPRLHADDWVSSVHLSRNSHVEFSGDMMLLRGVHEMALMQDESAQAQVIRSWRRLILAQHSASDTYVVPAAFAHHAPYDWATAWMRLLCGGISWVKTTSLLLTHEEGEMIVADAKWDSNSLIRLQDLPVQEAVDGSDTPQSNASMQHLDLHKNQLAASRALLDSKMFSMTEARLMGWGNHLVERGDEIWVLEG
jgi:hypothetical protein